MSGIRKQQFTTTGKAIMFPAFMIISFLLVTGRSYTDVTHAEHGQLDNQDPLHIAKPRYPAHSLNKVKLIFDTDIAEDCDDVGAMAVLHALADKGELEIL